MIAKLINVKIGVLTVDSCNVVFIKKNNNSNSFCSKNLILMY